MTKSLCNAQKDVELEDYTEMEDSDYQDFVSDDSEEDPTYIDDLDKAQSKFSNLSIKNKPNSSSRESAETERDDGQVSDMEEISAPKLGSEDMKPFAEVQRIIDRGQVEQLKVEQCKVYLRKHGLRLTGKKATLIQRIKEHLQILNGGGEKMFPSSSFVLNCKGDACMGDIVMFEQTVFEGYNILSRSAIGPPCGKRIVAGRIVKESYGAAKQQHTFTVEVLWSKGDKPLPPLHPLLIKGRNLYRLNTLRQRWEDESERRRVLSEKHSRGSIARSNREVRMQEKISKMSKGTRVLPKERQNSCQVKNRSATHDSKTLGGKAQKQQNNQEKNLKVSAEFKENSNVGLPMSQLPIRNVPASVLHKLPTSRVCLSYKDQNSTLSRIGDPKVQLSRPAESTLGSHYGFPNKFQQTRHHPRQQNHLEYKENASQPGLYPYSFQPRISNPSTYPFFNQNPQHESYSANLLTVSNRTSSQNFYGRNHHEKQQQPCRFYPQGKCYYGDRCKFLHEPK